MPYSKRTTIFVVDDTEAACQSLTDLFASAGWKCLAYADGQSLLEAVDPKVPDCLILSQQTPSMDGLAVLESLRSRRLNLPVIILTACGDVTSAVRAMKLGAADYLERPCPEHVLLDAVRSALDHDRTRRNRRAQIAAAVEKLARLTPRERQVVNLLADGRLTKQIAAELKISPKTVEVHRANIMRKTQANNIAELVRMVVYEQVSEDCW